MRKSDNMTEKKKLNRGVCPYCGCKDKEYIIWDDDNLGDTIIKRRDAKCTNCHKEHYEIEEYELKGYTI